MSTIARLAIAAAAIAASLGVYAMSGAAGQVSATALIAGLAVGVAVPVILIVAHAIQRAARRNAPELHGDQISGGCP